MITTKDLTVGQVAIIRRLADEDSGDQLYPIFSHHANGIGYVLAEVRWACDQLPPLLSDVQALLDADLLELDWDDEEEAGRIWYFALTESGELVANGKEELF